MESTAGVCPTARILAEDGVAVDPAVEPRACRRGWSPFRDRRGTSSSSRPPGTKRLLRPRRYRPPPGQHRRSRRSGPTGSPSQRRTLRGVRVQLRCHVHDRRKASADPLEVDDDEELLGCGQLQRTRLRRSPSGPRLRGTGRCRWRRASPDCSGECWRQDLRAAESRPHRPAVDPATRSTRQWTPALAPARAATVRQEAVAQSRDRLPVACSTAVAVRWGAAAPWSLQSFPPFGARPIVAQHV